jgi:hypothetical protein
MSDLWSKPAWVVRQAVNHPMASVIAYSGVTGLAIGYKPTRTVGLRMGSYGLRGAANLYRGALLGRGPGMLGTTFIRGGSVSATTAARGALGLAQGAMVGYAIGSVVGTGIAYAAFGDEGAKDALDFYTNPFGVDYFDTVGRAIKSKF